MSAAALAVSVPAQPPATDSWEGRCAVSGTLTVAEPFGGEPTFTTWHEEGVGRCTGVLDGVRVTDAPITVEGGGSGTLSCLAGGTDMRMANTVTFTRGTHRRDDDVAIGVSGRSFTVVGESVARMRGDVAGEALAHVDFALTSGFAAVEACSANAVRSMRFRATTQTLSTMRG